ncbi:MAG: hypothetical protein JJE22_11605, partial [Bacteroidia bacterium]|nr:hypothetical protein [Bacteroidia bacterium]
MKAKSIKGKSTEEIQSALEQSMADGFKPTLAIVFISIKQDRKAVCEILHQQDIDIIGATSSGEFINGHQSEGEAVLMLFDIDKNDYCILFEDIGKRGLSEAAEQMTKAALQKFNKPVFILCSTSLTADG